MNFGLDCYPCFLRQALEAARHTGLAETELRRILGMALEILQDSPENHSPPLLAKRINQEIQHISGNPDPYREVKRLWTQRALDLMDHLQALIAGAPDPLDQGLRLAVAGNIIDLAPGHAFDLDETLERVLTAPFAVDFRDEFRGELAGAQWVLYLGDNAGETVFDRVCIPTLAKPVKYAVKGGPIINDATIEDAREAGLHEVADLISSGSAIPGTVLADCDPSFQDLFAKAPLILAKGQANYETLSGSGDPRIFYLLQVKCPQIAKQLGAQGSLIMSREQ